MGTRIRLNHEDFYFWGFGLLNKWLRIKMQGGNLSEYFEDNRFTNIAVYGAGALGRRLLEELSDTKTKVLYVIDKNATNITDLPSDAPCFSLAEEWAQVDAVVITPIGFYEIRDEIQKKIGFDTDILAIDDIIDYCSK